MEIMKLKQIKNTIKTAQRTIQTDEHKEAQLEPKAMNILDYG